MLTKAPRSSTLSEYGKCPKLMNNTLRREVGTRAVHISCKWQSSIQTYSIISLFTHNQGFELKLTNVAQLATTPHLDIYINPITLVFLGYLGSVEAGKEYDATELVKKYSGPKPNILIDQVH